MSRAAVANASVRDDAARARGGPPRAGHRPHVPAAVLLDLQRTAGNRAVSGLIQRKFGFEAELQVNTFGREVKGALGKGIFADGKEGKDCPPAVRDFLLGGLTYSDELGRNDHFILKPDHGGQATTGVFELFSAIHGLENQFGRYFAPDPSELEDGEKPTNLEYESLPIDELDKDSDAKLLRQVEELGKHVAGIFKADALTRAIVRIPSPATDMWTGVPDREIKDWLGPAYFEKGISGWVGALKDKLQNKLYVQVTAGIIPSAVPLLYFRHAEEAQKAATQGGREVQVHGLMAQEVMDALTKLERNVFSEHSDFFEEELSMAEYDAFRGMLFLGYSYVVGEAVNQTGAIASTPKNTVPFLMQMTLPALRAKALPERLRDRKVPDEIVKAIAAHFAKRGKAETKNWLGNATALALNQSSESRSRMVEKGTVEAFFTGLLTEKNFDPFPFRREMKGDEQPMQVENASERQWGIPLEHRFILEQPSPWTLFRLLKRYLDQTRELNTRHMDEKEKTALIAAAEGKTIAGGTETKDQGGKA